MAFGSTIQIDCRERNSGIFHILRELGYEIEEKQLPVGDLIVEDLVIERKTVRDFQISVIDGRLFRQIYAMRRKYNRCLLIIEENTDEAEEIIHLNAAQGALIQITSGWQVPYLFSQDVSSTANLLRHIIDQEISSAQAREHDAEQSSTGLADTHLIKTRWGYKPRGQDRKRQYLLEGINGVGPKRGKALLSHFGSLRNIFNASAEELAGVHGIHDALAAYIEQFMTYGGKP